MVSLHSLSHFLSLLVFTSAFAVSNGDSNQTMFPMSCSSANQTCSASLYHVENGLSEDQIAAFYSVNSSQIRPIMASNRQDYLITVPCSCGTVGNTTLAYAYNTSYRVKSGDTLVSISDQTYSGQVWILENVKLFPDNITSIQLLCGCVDYESQIVVTYTIQAHDTLSYIAESLSSRVSDIEGMNQNLIKNPEFIQEGWVLFVPSQKNELQKQDSEKDKKHLEIIILGVASAVAIVSSVSLIFILIKRRRRPPADEEEPRAAVSKSSSSRRNFSGQNQYPSMDDIESRTKSIRKNGSNVPAFEPEKTAVFTIEEIEEATENFDETRKIGEGGFGTVYFGAMVGQEIAVKKMKSSKSKEFFAELKVLCKIHHINVVELLGYAYGDDHLYLVYEFVQNGSLSDHLHDPLPKGHQPLSWTARTQIALDAAKGIEYIHDHTKFRYVHRDIKTTNILLDGELRAKVADFGLAKLVGRTNEEDLIATRLVGTPGYLPPESVKELQVTPKTDVFAFGVVLAELITGKRALIRDKQQPNKTMSLIKIINMIFEDNDPEAALQAAIDENLRGSYPSKEAYKMAEIAACCLSEEAVNRPEMREIVAALSQIMESTIEWEASLGGRSQVFSGILSGR